MLPLQRMLWQLLVEVSLSSWWGVISFDFLFAVLKDEAHFLEGIFPYVAIGELEVEQS
jgi:hypothetical protein